MLGAILAILSAATFALNNAAVRRGVLTGTPGQAMAITVPIGVAGFLMVAIATGEISRLAQFPPMAAASMAAVGLVHFLLGRYCNYRANQEAGSNLTAPVVQLQVMVTLVLAVIILREPCTVLQMIGGLLMLAGTLITQRQPVRSRVAPGLLDADLNGSRSLPPHGAEMPTFAPRHVAGYLFASLAALAYGSSPILARSALEHTNPATGILGGLIAYAAATAIVSVAMLWPPLRQNVVALKRENVLWFVNSGVFVALAQGLFYAAVAVAPIMLVVPLLQLSLVFRLTFSKWLNPDHEVFGPLVTAGAIISIAGACLVSIDTSVILDALGVPEFAARVLRWRI
jgi:drug/metabolite transporter (DMT)-like permease